MKKFNPLLITTLITLSFLGSLFACNNVNAKRVKNNEYSKYNLMTRYNISNATVINDKLRITVNQLNNNMKYDKVIFNLKKNTEIKNISGHQSYLMQYSTNQNKNSKIVLLLGSDDKHIQDILIHKYGKQSYINIALFNKHNVK